MRRFRNSPIGTTTTKTMQTRIDALEEIYQAFERETAPYRSGAACENGCAFCCTDAGRIDCTTLEGLRIRDRIRKMPRPRQLGLKKALKRDMQKREAGLPSPCPFLMKNNACMIYPVRPFACRRIYSRHRCTHDHPPLINRKVMAIAEKTIAELQRLDDKGYSGHLSYILHMLDTPRFLATYRADDFKPEEIMAFGKTHRIAINRMVVTLSASPPI
jgi:uncharacterized protein